MGVAPHSLHAQQHHTAHLEADEDARLARQPRDQVGRRHVAAVVERLWLGSAVSAAAAAAEELEDRERVLGDALDAVARLFSLFFVVVFWRRGVDCFNSC